jgi:hypothetical protein
LHFALKLSEFDSGSVGQSAHDDIATRREQMLELPGQNAKTSFDFVSHHGIASCF